MHQKVVPLYYLIVDIDYKIVHNGVPMMDELFGSAAASRTLLYLQNYGDGHASAIARTFGMSRSQVGKQLHKFERGGIIVSRPIGGLRVYYWNHRNPLVEDLKAMLQRALEVMPDAEIQKHYRQRRRPRRAGKPA